MKSITLARRARRCKWVVIVLALVVTSGRASAAEPSFGSVTIAPAVSGAHNLRWSQKRAGTGALPVDAPWDRFRFAKPDETTVAEAIRRAGAPSSSYTAYVLDGEFDVFGPSWSGTSIVETRRRALAQGMQVVKVQVLEWSVRDRLGPVATLVFRGDRLWYAMTIPSPTETTPTQLVARYHQEPQTVTLAPKRADVIYSVKVYAYPKLGVAYTQMLSEEIETKFVFPPTDVLPFGPR